MVNFLKRALFFVLWVAVNLSAQQNPALASMDIEIAQLRRELSYIQIERQKNKDDVKKDLIESEVYRTRTQKRFSQIRNEIDTIKKSISIEKQRADSIKALMSNEINQQRQFTMNQDQLRTKIADICAVVEQTSRKMPPMVRKGFESSVSLLKSEILGKNIDNVEGLTRLFQVATQMYDATTSVQVSQENSPSNEMHGSTYRLRIGSFYESAVDIKGEKFIVWTSNDSVGNAEWKLHTTLTESSAMLKAAQIREGKALPSFAEIFMPFITVGER